MAYLATQRQSNAVKPKACPALLRLSRHLHSLPVRHPRESGDPVPIMEGGWIPAYAGMAEPAFSGMAEPAFAQMTEPTAPCLLRKAVTACAAERRA